jgi:hypothetical protein
MFARKHWLLLATGLLGPVAAPALAWGQVPTPFAALITFPFVNGAVSGNGADLTEDLLTNCQYTLPAGTLANIGDSIHIIAGGGFAASTDTKQARVYFGSAVPGQETGAIVAATSWYTDVWVTKTGSSAQSYIASNIRNGAQPAPITNTTTQTDTNTILLKVTGQNSTNSVLNSITCQFMAVEFRRVGQQ